MLLAINLREVNFIEDSGKLTLSVAEMLLCELSISNERLIGILNVVKVNVTWGGVDLVTETLPV